MGNPAGRGNIKESLTENNPLFQEKIRGLRQAGHTEESALRAAMHDGEGSSKGQDVLKSSRAHADAGHPGHRIKELNIRSAEPGVVIKHSYEKLPGENAGAKGTGGLEKAATPTRDQPLETEHAFSSTEDALNHVQQHIGGLFGHSTHDEDTKQWGGEWGRNRSEKY